MKTKQSAPIGANPLRAFLKKLPKQAAVLGSKFHHTPIGETIYVCYFWNGKTINQSFSWEGGAL